jgi:hypothetical protein
VKARAEVKEMCVVLLRQPLNPEFSRLNAQYKFLLVTLSLFLLLPLSSCGTYVLNAKTGTLIASPDTVAFGSVSVGQTASNVVALSNGTLAPVTITKVDLTGGAFSVVGPTNLPFTLVAGETYKLSVQFNPSSTGTVTGQMNVTSSASSGQATISLSGAGVTSTQATSALSSLSCGSGSMTGSGTDTCTVTLTSAAASGGISVSLLSSNPAVVIPNKVTIPANATSAGFIATVSPVVTAKAVTLTASLGNATRSFALLLSAAVATLSVNATSIPFGNVLVNTTATQSITMTSTGTAPVTISGATLTGAGFTLPGAKFPATLNPNQETTLDVEFDPTAAGAATGQLIIASNSSTGAASAVSLSGTGLTSSGLASVTIGKTPGRTVPATFMGLSHEWGSAQTIMGDSETGVNTIYRQLLKNLMEYGSGPIILRIGGGSTDTSGEPTSTVVRPFAEMANDLDVRFYLGVNLGANDIHLAIDQAKAYVDEMPPGSLEAIEIGNEPDGYATNGMRPSSYTFADYLGDFDKWKANINPLLPTGTKLLGPSWGDARTLSNTHMYLSNDAGDLLAFSQHLYVADGKAANPPDILLKPNSATMGPKAVASAVIAAHQFNLPFRMGEMNSLWSGGESGVSDTFQSALWAIDNMFRYIDVGVDGVNWQVGSWAGNPYNPFSVTVAKAGNKSSYSIKVNPLYYGILMFQAATGHNSAMLPVTLQTNANLCAWATMDDSGTARVVLINKDEQHSGTVTVSLPGFNHATIYRLSAPNYQATSGITYAGQTFGSSSDGFLHGSQTLESVTGVSGDFKVNMPITGAALIVFAP